MTRHIPTALAASALVVALSVASTQAQSPSGARAAAVCGQHAELVEGFAQEFGEFPLVAATTDLGHAMEVLVSQTHGTWTIVITSPGGPSCAVATGQDWEQLKIEPKQVTERPL